MNKPNIFVFDLDGTIANAKHRLHHIRTSEKKDWDAFYRACIDDTPIQPTITIMTALFYAGYSIYIITGRNKSVEKETLEWLKRHKVPFHLLAMRPEGDHRPDDTLKPILASFVGATPENVQVVFEDRSRMVNKWRSLGYVCYQVAEGDF